MKACGTYDDVNLILKLFELRREAKMREARAWFVKSFHAKNLDEFNKLCPPGSEQHAYFRMVVSYWDMAASFITNGVLHRELFFESGRELLLTWERVRGLLAELRESNGDAKTYANLEAVGKAYEEWMKQRGPRAYEAFVERVNRR